MNQRVEYQRERHEDRAVVLDDLLKPLGFEMDVEPHVERGQWVTGWTDGRIRVIYTGYQQVQAWSDLRKVVGVKFAAYDAERAGARLVTALERERDGDG